MKNIKDKLYKIAPYFVAVLLFAAVSVIGFAPQLEGKVLPQHDTQQFDGMSRDIRECRAEYDEDPQWTGAMFSGMPAYQINIKYPTQIIKRSVDWLQSLFAAPASMVMFAMLSAFVMALLMGMSAWVGIIIGLAYGLSTYFFLIIGAGHITKMWALVYAPALIGAVHHTLRRNMWVGGSLAALFATLELGANHPQISYYFFFAIVALWISELIHARHEVGFKEFAKRTAVLAAAAILAIGANFSQIYYTMQHTEDTVRGGSSLVAEGQRKGLDIEYATAWSYGIDESFNMLIPNFMGGDSGNTFSKDGIVAETLKEVGISNFATQLPAYWGEQPYTAGPTYLGAIVIMLALLGLLLAPNRERVWIIVPTILALFMAWGYHAMWFTQLCFDILPLYNKFRAVSTALVVVEWSVPLLAGIGLWQLYKQWDSQKRIKRAIALAGGITAAVCLLFAVGGDGMFDFARERDGEMMSEQFYYMLQNMQGGEEYIARGLHNELGWSVADAMASERAEIMSADAWRSLLFVLCGTALLFAALLLNKIGRRVAFTLLALLIIVDILPVNLRYLPYETFITPSRSEIKATEADLAIMEDKELGYRVFNCSVSPFNDATTSKFHRSVGGYHGAKMGRYQDIIDRYLMRADERVLDMLNTKYIITPEGDVVVRPTANGAAWFVKELNIVEQPDEALDALATMENKSVAVAEAGAPLPTIEGEGRIELAEYRPNYLRYNYSLEGGAAVAIFSEIYYDKGWQAYLDGEPCDSFRANYILRAMVLPEGEHTVEWRFRAPNWSLMSAVTLICSILIIFALATTLIIYIYGFCKKGDVK